MVNIASLNLGEKLENIVCSKHFIQVVLAKNSCMFERFFAGANRLLIKPN